jgi:hypothetical protein
MASINFNHPSEIVQYFNSAVSQGETCMEQAMNWRPSGFRNQDIAELSSFLNTFDHVTNMMTICIDSVSSVCSDAREVDYAQRTMRATRHDFLTIKGQLMEQYRRVVSNSY